MELNELTGIIVDESIKMHSRLGPGLLESVYEEILHYRISLHNLTVQRQMPIPVFYDEIKMDIGFRADLLVENRVIVEIKSIEKLAAVHFKILLTYLKLSGIKIGLLINFNEERLKNGIHRMVNNL